jgi:predicted DCC family thiol-disulfide oxidoreductase YuxK
VSDHPLILFDGVCNFCNASVNFIIERDPEGVFRFAPLQSPYGQETLRKFHLSTTDLDTMVLIEGDRPCTRSTAGLKIARRLSGLWPFLSVFLIVPRFLRDAVYSFIARNRYRWWGRQDACMVPTPEVRERFLS